MTKSAQILPSSQKSSWKPHIVFLSVPPIQVLDLTGPFEVFSRVSRFGLGEGYELTVAEVNPTRATCGLSIGPSQKYSSIKKSIDTLLIVGGEGIEDGCYTGDVLRWIKRKAARTRRIGSICTGAFLLAHAGLLDGRNAVTHWAYCQRLAQQYRRIKVQPEPIFVKDGNVYTSAGITAGIDLALSLVEEDYGTHVAQRIARDLVLYLRRHGNQAQFSHLLHMQEVSRRPIQDLITWINENVRNPITVDSLAGIVGMSPRHFARIFLEETGFAPAKFVETVRLEAAKRMLETSQAPIKEIAFSLGFGDSSTLRRIFAKRLQISPDQYRKRFRD